ncbi:MAG: 2-oxoacid:acceptor oxidoreductase family protein [Candidatus Bathyarchaeota archaeon]|nr:2-oxoacid:ferredoxin oxidoreductase subunit gamma [Candidatus Bathyarchaeota archaeon A05DMB-5]MDH7557513.1 2-oxoacid:acceptor oxidoreductase family protein [Candidatus Bathyarchaeota archaeon]
MKIEVRISGLGGQGVVLAGQILGKAAVYDGKNVAQTQSYGAEARGSAAKSEVIISDSKIGFPAVRKSDILIAMSQQALEKHLKDLKENGVLLVDSTYVKKIPETTAKVLQIPATENAEKMFGAKICANMIMLGALAKATNIVSEKAMQKAIEDTVTRKTVDINKRAYKYGAKIISPNIT